MIVILKKFLGNMNDKFTLPIVVEDGQMIANSVTRERLNQWVMGYTGKLYATYDKKKPKRSTNINRYYWGVVLPIISEDTGHTNEELHSLFKDMFLTKETKKVLGEEVKIVKSTTDLTTGEFMQYLDRISSHTEIALPNPEEAGYISNY